MEEAGRLEGLRELCRNAARRTEPRQHRRRPAARAQEIRRGLDEDAGPAMADRRLAEQREQGRPAPVRHRHELPLARGARLRWHHRRTGRLGGADAARAGQRQPQPDRGAAELCRREALRQRGLLRFVLPEPVRQPVAERTRNLEQCRGHAAAVVTRAAGDPQPAGGAAAGQPGAPDRCVGPLRVHADHAPELQAQPCAGPAARRLRRCRLHRRAGRHEQPRRARRHHARAGGPERTSLGQALAAGETALRGQRRPHADRALQRRGHGDLHQPASAQHQVARPVAGELPVQQRLPRLARRRARIDRSRRLHRHQRRGWHHCPAPEDRRDHGARRTAAAHERGAQRLAQRGAQPPATVRTGCATTAAPASPR